MNIWKYERYDNLHITCSLKFRHLFMTGIQYTENELRPLFGEIEKQTKTISVADDPKNPCAKTPYNVKNYIEIQNEI